MAIFGNFKDNFATVFKKSLISILNIIDLIYGNLSNFKDNYDTATKTANKSMGLTLVQLNLVPRVLGTLLVKDF